MNDTKNTEKDKTVAASVSGNEMKYITPESVWCECAGDFTLPDYMPEIAKMLSCTPRIIPSGKYIGSERAEFSGCVVYSVIYAGDDGLPFYTTLTGDYEYTAPLGAASSSPHVEIYDEPTIESVSIRASGPRKITARARICAVPHILYEDIKNPPEPYDDVSENYQKLTERVREMEHRHFESGEFTVEESFKFDASHDAEPVGCEGNACISETVMVAGNIRIRGEVECRVLYYDIVGGRKKLLSTKEKLRFEREIPLGALADVTGVRAYPRVISTGMSLSDSGDILLEITINVCGEYTVNSEKELLCDIYSCAHTCDVNYEKSSYRREVLCKNMNLSYHAQKDLQLDGDGCEVAVSYASVRVGEVNVADGVVSVSGEISVDCLISYTEEDRVEYSPVSIPVPFRCEAPVSSMADRYDVSVVADVSGVRTRVEKDSISADAELYLALFIGGEDSMRTVESVTLGEEKVAAHRDSVCVYYPDKNETLWSVAKKYKTPTDVLARNNSILASAPDSELSLDGVTSLIIV